MTDNFISLDPVPLERNSLTGQAGAERHISSKPPSKNPAIQGGDLMRFICKYCGSQLELPEQGDVRLITHGNGGIEVRCPSQACDQWSYFDSWEVEKAFPPVFNPKTES